ncbi:MAG: MarR family transcriptional regulator [Dehalococcoidia bacterium]|nr:MarR family transcriptional regulator [Dehalococcoidia bacterium]
MPPSPAAVDETLDTVLCYLGEALAIFDPLRFRAWAELGLTTAQLRVLFLVRGTPGVTAGELAARLAVTPPTISGIVDRLVRQGLMRREEDCQDRRLVRNQLTAAGESACSRLEQGAEAFTRRILNGMNQADLHAFLVGLEAFVRASHAAGEPEPGLLAAVPLPGASTP